MPQASTNETPSPDTHTATADRLVLETCDLVGTVIEFWGFRKILGRIWTLLFLSPEPLAAADIKESLGVSVGGVSMGLKELERWGVVRRAYGRIGRREYFEAETNLWKMISRVMRERERAYVENAIEQMGRIQQELRQRAGRPGEGELADFRLDRIEQLMQAARITLRLIDGLLSTARLDATPLRNLKLVRALPFRRRN